MAYDNALVAGKLRRWEKYLDDFRLPRWEEIPNLGLYMEQVTVLLREYLDYLPPELKDEQFITAATINNYVRIKVMPEPVKRRYYRVHIAYLIIILTLKQSLSIALIQKVIPMGLSEEDVEVLWDAIINMFEIDHSAARGKMCMRKLYIFKHDCMLGNAPSHLLFDKINIEQKGEEPPRAFRDYEISVDRQMPEGVELIEKL